MNENPKTSTAAVVDEIWNVQRAIGDLADVLSMAEEEPVANLSGVCGAAHRLARMIFEDAANAHDLATKLHEGR